MYYAQLNNSNIVEAVTQTSGVIVQSNMIAIDSFDMSLLGKQYVNGEFVDVPQEP